MFLNYVNSDDIFGQININRLIYRTSPLRITSVGSKVKTNRCNASHARLVPALSPLRFMTFEPAWPSEFEGPTVESDEARPMP